MSQYNRSRSSAPLPPVAPKRRLRRALWWSLTTTAWLCYAAVLLGLHLWRARTLVGYRAPATYHQWQVGRRARQVLGERMERHVANVRADRQLRPGEEPF